MLSITIPKTEYWDSRSEMFITVKEQTLQLEHSLVSLSKWESKWEKPFLTKETKSTVEWLDYIRCMTITQNVDPIVYKGITNDIFNQIKAYIDAKMTATWFSEETDAKKGSSEAITAEIIYYWMISFNIPFECQKWHLNKLLTLIRVCNVKNAPPKKVDKRKLLEERRRLNQARKTKLRTKG